MKNRFLLATWLLLLSIPSAAIAQPPIARTPGYEHDRYVTQPRDYVVEFQAYISSFDTNDDDDGDGEPMN